MRGVFCTTNFSPLLFGDNEPKYSSSITRYAGIESNAILGTCNKTRISFCVIGTSSVFTDYKWTVNS